MCKQLAHCLWIGKMRGELQHFLVTDNRNIFQNLIVCPLDRDGMLWICRRPSTVSWTAGTTCGRAVGTGPADTNFYVHIISTFVNVN